MKTNIRNLKIKNKEKKHYTLQGIIIVLVIITLYSFTTLGLTVDKHNPILDAHYFRFGQMLRDFLKFNMDFKKFGVNISLALISTFGMGFLSTLIGLVFGGALALLSAKNLSNKYVSDIIRGISAGVRAVPTFLIVLLCISIYGMTGTSAIIGMSFHSAAFFVKVLGESFEEVDSGNIEGIRAIGGNWFDVVYAVVLPSSLREIIAWTVFRLEINFGIAVVMGPFAAVQYSLGTELRKAVMEYNFSEIFLTVTVVFMSMYILQCLAEKYKRNIKEN